MNDHIANPGRIPHPSPASGQTPRAPRSSQHFPSITDHATLVELAMRMALELWTARRLARSGAGGPAAD